VSGPTFLSLFSGIGGLDLGLERAGWECVGQVEIDPFCQRVLAKHWPHVPRWGDIREVDPDDLPRADLIAGGFPCQPVSSAGKRLGQDDPRWLWPQAARLVRQLRPRWLLLENVPGLLARGMGDVLGELAACGYDAEWDCIPASAVGAPHQRDRVWIVAYPDGRGWLGRGQPCSLEGQRANSARVSAADPERQQLRHEPGRRNGPGRSGTPVPGDDGQAWPLADPAGARREAGTPGAGRAAWDDARRPGPGGLGGAVADADGLGRLPGRHDPRQPEVTEPLHRGMGNSDSQGRHQWPRVFGDGRGQPQPAHDGWWSVEPDVGRVAHGVPVRVDRLRALGNAVVPQVAELIGRRILEAGAA
jgi:DNA (cytosine-5)-methyltransferase 1